MSSNEMPEPWAQAFLNVGLTDPRYTDPRPSAGRLGKEIGVHTSTITAMINGTRHTKPWIVAAAAQALRRPVSEVSGWVNQARTVDRPYTPPAEVNLLSEREQRALTDLIMAIVRTREEMVGNVGHPAPKTQPPATVDDGDVIVPGEETGKQSRGGSRGRRPKTGRQGPA